MRIGMILINGGGFPPDIRVEKEARALSQAGHEVFILCRMSNTDSPGVEFLSDLGATVVRRKVPQGGKIFKGLFSLMVYDQHWKNIIRQFVIDYAVDALHAHDLYGVPPTVRVAKKLDIPIVADLHENMPAAARAYRSIHPFCKRLLRSIVWNYWWMRYREASILQDCTRILIVVPEAAKRLVKYGVPEERIVVVSNTEDENTFKFDKSLVDETIASKYKNKWITSYIGGIGPHRGIDTTLKAVREIQNIIPNFLLLVVGAKNLDVQKQIRQECARLDIENSVEIVGWQPFEKVNSYVMISNVCLVPHNNFEHTQTTVPHKLFQYMICQKPVLVSDCAPLKRIVNDAECGVVFNANNSTDMAKKLIWMYENSGKLTKIGEKGREAALGKYSWRQDAQRLVNMYQNLEKHIKLQ